MLTAAFSLPAIGEDMLTIAGVILLVGGLVFRHLLFSAFRTELEHEREEVSE